MKPKALQFYFLTSLFIATLIVSFFIFRPFLVTLALATVCAVVLHPFYQSVLRRMSGSPGLAAFLTMLLSIVCILIPLTFITAQIAESAQHLSTSLSGGGGEIYLTTALEHANGVATEYAPNLAMSSTDLASLTDQYVQNGLHWLIQNMGRAFGGVAHALFSFFIFLFALYYLLRDGTKLKQLLVKASPLADDDDELVLSRLALAVNSVIHGSLMIALIQGVLTGIGFAFFGVPNSVLWGVAAAFSALIPGIGTSLVLIPGVVYLFLTGATTSATGLLIWSMLAVGLIDNLLGPRLMGRGMQLHPLVVLLSVFGGIAFFGPAGVFLGPLSISLLLALLSIYQHIAKQPA
ncbi:MAG: AI-2E family transporter [Minisyncoccota bacterium]